MLMTVASVGFGASMVSNRRMAAGWVPVRLASNAFDTGLAPHFVERAHERVHRVDAGARLRVGRGEFPILHLSVK